MTNSTSTDGAGPLQTKIANDLGCQSTYYITSYSRMSLNCHIATLHITFFPLKSQVPSVSFTKRKVANIQLYISYAERIVC